MFHPCLHVITVRQNRSGRSAGYVLVVLCFRVSCVYSCRPLLGVPPPLPMPALSVFACADSKVSRPARSLGLHMRLRSCSLSYTTRVTVTAAFRYEEP